MSAAGDPTAEILLIEDNPGDVRLIQEAFRETGRPHHLRVAADGAHALAILRQPGAETSRSRPDLIILDLNLPGTDGRTVLRTLKADPALASIPVVVLTSSDDERDIRQAYAAGANCYVVKPLDLDHFLDTLGAIEQFWLITARLPARPEAAPS
jgi:CheY-like chemotaxis protein